MGLQIHAQFNIKVGYNLGFAVDDKIGDIVDRFNKENDFFNQPLGDIEGMGGIELGLRYRFKSSAIELSWINNSARARGFGNDGSTPVEADIDASMRTFSLGLETMYGPIGIGSSIDRRRLKLKQDIPNFDATETVSQSSGWAAKLHLTLEARSSSMSLTFKPYIQFPLSNLNVYGLEKSFFPDSEAVENDFDTDFLVYGISIVIYNGPQR